MSSQQELLVQLQQAEADRLLAKKKIAGLKIHLMEREFELINANIRIERAQEALEKIRNSDPTYIPDARDREIERFRDKFPELCEKSDDPLLTPASPALIILK